MTWRMRMVLGLASCLVCVPSGMSQESPSKSKVAVELRWVESKPIEGVTEEEGIQTSCDPDSLMYPHKKPAMVLTSAEVKEASLANHDFSRNGLSRSNYMVTIHLTKEAREKLAATCKSDKTQMLTVVVDGEYWGVHRYEKDKTKPFVPWQARAETFLPQVGFFSSMAEAHRLVNALK